MAAMVPDQQTMASFVNVTQLLMSQENVIRKQAEETYKGYVDKNPSLVMTLLVNILQAGDAAGTVQLRTFAPVLLRQLVASPAKVGKLDKNVLELLQNQVIDVLGKETNSAIRTKLCHVVGSLVASYEQASVGIEQRWANLLPFTLSLVNNTADGKSRELGLLLLSKLAEYAQGFVRNGKNHVFSALSNAFEVVAGSTLDGKVYLTQATINFLLCLEPENLRDCEPVMQPLLNTLSELLRTGDELSARDSMKSLIDLVCNEGATKFMPNGITQLSEAMLTVTSTTSFEASTRQLALESLVSLSDISPGAMRRRTDFVTNLVKTIISMMTEEGDLDDDFKPDVYSEFDESEKDQDSMLGSAIDALNRLCCKLGGRAVLPSVFGTCPSLIADGQNWRNRRAGVLAISASCTGAKKMLKGSLPKLFQMVLPLLQGDGDQRVRYFATGAAAQMLDDFNGTVQETMHGQILPVIGAALYDASQSGNCNRVRAAVANMVITYANPETCPSDAILPYLEPLLNGLFSILNTPNVHYSVQEQAISAIANVARVAGENFGNFYNGFMPAAKTIIAQATSAEHQELRGKTMECVALIGEAVGRERFLADAKEVLEMMLTVQANAQTSSAANDPGLEYIIKASSRICRAIGDAFVPYLQYVIPGLLAKAASETDYSIVDALDTADQGSSGDAQEDDNGMSSVVLDIKGVGKKRITLNTNDVFEKEIAIRALYEYLDVLEQHMAPYVEMAAKAITPLIVYRYAPSIRDVASLMVPKLVNSLALAQSGNTKMIADSVAFMMPNLMEQLQKEVNIDVLCSTSEAVKETMRIICESGGFDESGKLKPARFSLPLAVASSVTEVLCNSANKSATRRNEALKEAQEKGFEEEDYEQLEEELESEEELMTNFIDSCGYILKTHRAAFLPIFDAFLAVVFTPLLQPTQPTTLRHNAMCVFDDVIEHCGDGAHKYLNLMLPAALQYATDPEPYMRQAAVYGIRIAAEQAPQQFAQYAAPALNILTSIVNQPDSRNEDNAEATENAIAAMGAICKFHSGSPGVNLANALPLWLSTLPLKEDEECAQLTAAYLCGFLQTSGQMLLGGNFEHAPQAMSAITQMLVGCQGGGEDSAELTTPQTKEMLQMYLKQMVSSLPSQAKETAWSRLSDAQKGIIQRL